MAKRPFIVSDDEEATNVPVPTPEELEAETERLIRKFDRKYGFEFPRLLAALKAEEVKDNGFSGEQRYTDWPG